MLRLFVAMLHFLIAVTVVSLDLDTVFAKFLPRNAEKCFELYEQYLTKRRPRSSYSSPTFKCGGGGE